MLKQITFNSPPYYILWQSALSFLVVGFMLRGKNIDIQLHDIYVVLSLWHVGVVLGGALAFMGLVYWLFRKQTLNHWMSLTHTLTSVFGASIFFLGDIVQSVLGIEYLDIFDASFYVYVLISIVFMAAQLLLPLNLLLSFLKKRE